MLYSLIYALFTHLCFMFYFTFKICYFNGNMEFVERTDVK